MSGIVERLQVLKQTTDEILDRCKPGDFNEAINWGDLKCFGAYYRVDLEGDESWQVVIDECSPDCELLPAHVSHSLETLGFSAVEVRCEW